MPIYEYRCPDGHVTDQRVPMAEAPGPDTVRCPQPPTTRSERSRCGKTARRAEVNRVGVIFHADGFTRRVAP